MSSVVASPAPSATPAGVRSRTYQYEVAGFDAAAALSMTGLEYMRALVGGEIGAKPPIADTLGMSIPFDLEYGKASFEGEPEDFLMNPIGVIHGGFAATLLDSAMAIAVHTALPKATVYTTAELKINFIRAILPTSGRVRAEGTLIHAGRQLATAEGRLVGVEDGKLYAHGTTTCLILPIPPKKA